MSETERINTDNLASVLRGLKNLSKNDYKKALHELHYDGPSFKTPKQFDAFLLKVVYERFDTVDTDYILISLGLLLGYKREIGIGKRYEKYLRDSSYIQDVYSGDCKDPYDSVDEKQKNRYKAALRDLADGRIEKLAEVIAEIKKQEGFEEYIKAALTDYYDESNNTVRLKKPYYATIRQKNTSSIIGNNSDTDSESTVESGESESATGKNDDKHKGKSINPIPPEPNNMSIKITSWIKRTFKVGLIFALFLVVMIFAKPVSLFLTRFMEASTLYSIEFKRTGRWLPYGEEMELDIIPKPGNASLKGLRCKSGGDNAHMIEILSEQNLRIRATKEPEDSDRCPVDIEAYMDYDEDIKDVMTIYIIKDGQNESTGEGELDDKKPGDSSQRVDQYDY